jgi:hypothetical protein
MVLAAAAAAFFAYRLGERIQLHGGYGWDGVIYGRLAEHFRGFMTSRGLQAYYVPRVLPSLIVHYGMRLVRLPRTAPNIVCVFGLLNVVLITVSAWVWCRLADHEGISMRGKWLGFFGLFVNFALLKWPSYYPVLTDSYGFLLSLLMLYFHVQKKTWNVLAVTALGALVWPVLMYQGVILAAFRCAGGERAQGKHIPWGLNRPLALLAALSVGVLVGALPVQSYHFLSPVIDRGNGPLCYQPVSLVVMISVVCVFLYVWLGLKSLWNEQRLFEPQCWFRSFQIWPALFGLALMLAVRWLSLAVAKRPSIFTMPDLLMMIGWESIKHPCIFAVAHAVYYGPIILLALLNWPALCRVIHGYGLGLTLCVTANFVLSLDPESRHLIHFLPIIVLVTAKAMEQVRWDAVQCTVVAVLALGFSKVWMNLGGRPDTLHSDQFPAQLLFMNIGPWMSATMYLVQGGYVVLSGCLLFFVIHRRPVPFDWFSAASDGDREQDSKRFTVLPSSAAASWRWRAVSSGPRDIPKANLRCP